MNYGFIRFLPDLKFQGGQQPVHPGKEHDQGAQEHDQTKVSSTDKNYKVSGYIYDVFSDMEQF